MRQNVKTGFYDVGGGSSRMGEERDYPSRVLSHILYNIGVTWKK